MTRRYGQLSYTSFDEAGRPGGWQVKQRSGDISDDECHLLVSRIHIALNPIEQLPQYPTAAQLTLAPRRLAYRRLGAERAAYWHTAPAGADSMGRPGNVFAHVVLDRDASTSADGGRPIEWWRSPGWLTPYGSAAVSEATLPAEAPAPGRAVTSDSVAQFACDTSTWRLSALCAVLDALAAALDGGPAVVLGVESPDVAAQWIGLVSFLTSPGTAKRLNFSTFDRGGELACGSRINQHLLAVPRNDLADVPDVPGRVLVIDEAEAVSVGELYGQAHRTTRGQDIEVTAWSAMAQVGLVNPASTEQLLADIDEFSAAVTDVGLPPALPMAMSVLNRQWGKDAALEAESVIASYLSTPFAVRPGGR
ncbi:hypothetical protein [Mycobacterium intracellulare]|uniref:GAP1-N2 domain-containing protein n=1 Tax=Mycobacterium intracellulare TaxID=1767 RepID=UPI000BAED77C|nr:hypothetical protein [Mycobacterium intracellulare]PBA57185.1 hypothetical protein CKJ57_22440 [Mycobacterium intracellulare subsp. chimaera]